MNNKLLLPLVLSILTGCVSTRPATAPVAGTGGGIAGSQQSNNNAKTVSPALTASTHTTNSALGSNKFSASSINTTVNGSTVIDKTPYVSNNSTTGNPSASQIPQSSFKSTRPQVEDFSTNRIKSGLTANSKSEITLPVLENTPRIVASYESNHNMGTAKSPLYPDITGEPKLKQSESEKIENQASDVLTKTVNKRYSNNTNKAVPSSHPTSAGNPSSYIVSGENYKVLPFSNGFVEKGIASWYGPDFHGEKTSNGEIYDMYGMTAAHKRLPIPSYVKVTNLKNKRSVILRINDRGPFYPDRVIDLSYGAAQKLDIHQPGTEMVQIEAVNTASKESVYLQLGVFANPANAQLLQKKIVENKMPQPEVKEVVVEGKPAYRVQLGPLFSADKVNEFTAKLAKIGIAETWYVTDSKI